MVSGELWIKCVSSSTGSLIDNKGKILVPGMYKDVAPVTKEEEKLYEKIDFDLDEYCKDVGVGQLLHDTKARIWNLLLTQLKKYNFAALLLVTASLDIKIIFVFFL